MDFIKAPKASDVINHLERLIARHGDLKICADDPDTDYRMEIGIVHKNFNRIEGWPERFEIKTDYHCSPKGLIENEI